MGGMPTRWTRCSFYLVKRKLELWETNQLKLEKIIRQQSSQSVVTTPHSEQVNQRAKATKAWFEQIIIEGVQSIKDANKVLGCLTGIEERLENMHTSFNQELKTLDEDLSI